MGLKRPNIALNMKHAAKNIVEGARKGAVNARKITALERLKSRLTGFLKSDKLRER